MYFFFLLTLFAYSHTKKNPQANRETNKDNKKKDKTLLIDIVLHIWLIEFQKL